MKEKKRKISGWKRAVLDIIIGLVEIVAALASVILICMYQDRIHDWKSFNLMPYVLLFLLLGIITTINGVLGLVLGNRRNTSDDDANAEGDKADNGETIQDNLGEVGKSDSDNGIGDKIDNANNSDTYANK